MSTDLSTLQDRAGRFTLVVDGVTDWSSPTPCEGWTASDVLTHVIETERDFLARQGLSLPDVDLTAPAGAWSEHVAAVSAILEADGVAEREYDGFFGRTTIGATMADFYGWDLVVHGWDLAVATGQEWSLSDQEATAMMQTADGWGDALYSEGICAAPVPVPDGASGRDQLLGRLGRDPRWSPAG